MNVPELGLPSQKKIKTAGSCLQFLSDLRAAATRPNETRIVFTNGCFDLIHPGHLMYLEQARLHGTALVVGLNSDASVKRLKGASRPVNGQYERALLLAALQFVDAVVIFEEDTPADLIAFLTPDVLIKGGDYTPDQIAGAETVRNRPGGEVKILPFVEGYSSTRIIEKIRSFDNV